MPAHRLWMKSGASGRAINFNHSTVDDHKDDDCQSGHRDLHDKGLQEQAEQRTKSIAISVSSIVSNAEASMAVFPDMIPALAFITCCVTSTQPS